MTNVSAVPPAPPDGKIVTYAEAGKFSVKNSDGTVTTLEPSHYNAVLDGAWEVLPLQPALRFTGATVTDDPEGACTTVSIRTDYATVATVGNVANLTTTTKTSTVAAINEVVSDLANYVPKTRTINGKALSSNIIIANSDIGSEPSIAEGTTSQYWRGDKTWAILPTNDGATVISSWVATDHKSWYRIWSDGWIEQGGQTSTISSATYTSITFPTSFLEYVSTIVASYNRSSLCGDYRALYTSSLTKSGVNFTNY
jgi:hypothetical protein